MALNQCPECGKDISSEAIVCPHCGYPIKEKEQNKESQPKKSSGVSSLIAFLSVLVILGGIAFAAIKTYDFYHSQSLNGENIGNNDGNPFLLTRAATTADFSLTSDVEASLTSLKDTYLLVPNVDISNLRITLTYLDKNKTEIKTVSKNIGTIYKNTTNHFSVEHTLSDMLKISSFRYSVSGGSVSYFNN